MLAIAVDCMGGDAGLSVTLPACAKFLEQQPQARLVLVGDAVKIQGAWKPHPRAEVVHAGEAVTMEDSVEVALRRKKDSSMRLAIEKVRDGGADAAVSAGNTGALMAIARYVLKTMEGIDRPAIATEIPNAQGASTTVLDLGANIDCEAEHLLQFALMGSALVSSLSGKEAPVVGLLNIGEEMIKGGEVIKQAGELLRQAHARGALVFRGNVEGNDIFTGTVDIVVCDGFVGNVALKTMEGLASMLGGFLRQSFSRNLYTRLAGLFALPVLHTFRRKVDHRRYNGAALLGLRGLVFKSHGGADAEAFGYALHKAYAAVQHNLLRQVHARIEKLAAAALPVTD